MRQDRGYSFPVVNRVPEGGEASDHEVRTRNLREVADLH